MKKILYLLTAIILFSSCQKDVNENDIIEYDTLISDIDVSSINYEAKRYYGNMADFMSLTTNNLKSSHISKLKSSTTDDSNDFFNPIIEEFANIEIFDEFGNQISFFDLSNNDREVFLEHWATVGATDMTPKLNDNDIGKELEEYIQIQNDAFDEVMEELGGCDEYTLKSAVIHLPQDELYNMISSRVKERIKEKSKVYAEELLKSNPELSNTLKSSKKHKDYVDPNKVLEQLRKHANRGDILINLPGSVWLSAYLFYYEPLAITKYVGIGTYPPGHVSIVKQTKTNLPSLPTEQGVSISAQSGRGVINENVYSHWSCKAHLCYVKKRVWQWRGFKSRFKTVYPNADKVIAYAESQMDKPYCSGWNFVTAKSRTSCFICTTITWRSFNREGFNIHRSLARWMPTIAPADILLSSHVVEKHKIK